MSWLRVAREWRTMSKSGWGLPRQKLDRVQVAFLSMLNLLPWCNCWSSGCIAPACNTRSRQGGESPAMLPNAHTACSLTSSLGLSNNLTNMGTAPTSITTLVCSLVPLAIFVKAHAASNCKAGLSSLCKNSTKRGTTPESITCWMGGFFSMERRRRNWVVHSVWIAGSLPITPETIWGRFSSLLPPAPAPGAAERAVPDVSMPETAP
mmetsp:Transcript_159/g.264  ORF Transcript_159/g.264 Transcript_159/m.264 type:complete len:207 (-) Transcript_159:13-633(-)